MFYNPAGPAMIPESFAATGNLHFCQPIATNNRRNTINSRTNQVLCFKIPFELVKEPAGRAGFTIYY